MILATAATANYQGFKIIPTQELASFVKPNPSERWGREITISKRETDLSASIMGSYPKDRKPYEFVRLLRPAVNSFSSRMNPIDYPAIPKKPDVKEDDDRDEIIKWMMKYNETIPFILGYAMVHISYLGLDITITDEEHKKINEVVQLMKSKLNAHPIMSKETVSQDYANLKSMLDNLSPR